MSKEEIARVKAEWEAKEERKKDNKAKAAAGEKGAAEGAPGEKKDDAADDKKKSSSDKSPSPPVPGSLPSPPAAFSSSVTPTHKRYNLHRDFYAMRQAEHRRKRQTKQTHELAPRLPGAPRGSLAG